MSKKQENRPVVVGDTVTRRQTTFSGDGGEKIETMAEFEQAAAV